MMRPGRHSHAIIARQRRLRVRAHRCRAQADRRLASRRSAYEELLTALATLYVVNVGFRGLLAPSARRAPCKLVPLQHETRCIPVPLQHFSSKNAKAGLDLGLRGGLICSEHLWQSTEPWDLTPAPTASAPLRITHILEPASAPPSAQTVAPSKVTVFTTFS